MHTRQLLAAPILILGAVALAGVPAVGAGEGDDEEGVPRIVDVEPRVVDVVARVESLANGAPETTTSETSDQVVIDVATDVLFAFDSATLTPAAQALLESVAATVSAEATGTVTIHGHTDSVGDPGYNQVLSEQRAAAVHGVLEPAVGRDDLAYQVGGFGETQPVAANELPDGSDNPEGRQRNRRVTVTYAKAAE